MRFISRVVKEVDTDLLCHLAGHSTILGFRDFPLERYQQTEPWLLGRVLVRRIHAKHIRNLADLFLPYIGSTVVHVECKERPAVNVPLPPDTAFKMPANKAAFVFDIRLLRLAHGAVLLYGLCRYDGLGDFTLQFLPRDFRILPFPGFPAVAVCNLKLHRSQPPLWL